MAFSPGRKVTVDDVDILNVISESELAAIYLGMTKIPLQYAIR
jgi:hypothetical protein